MDTNAYAVTLSPDGSEPESIILVAQREEMIIMEPPMVFIR